MKYLIALLLPLLLTACLEPLTEDPEGVEYTVQAYLTANEKVTGIEVRKILRYVNFEDWVKDSTTLHTEHVVGAKVVLKTKDSTIVVPQRDLDSTYQCDHVAIPGETYHLTVTVFDSTKGREITFTSSTTVPAPDPSLQLNNDTLYIDSNAIRNDFWGLVKSPESYEHLTLTSERADESYRLLEFTPMGWSIFRVDEGGNETMGIKQVPLKQNPRVISQLDIGYFGVYYEYYRVVIRQVQQEYVDLYREDATDKTYWLVIPTSIYPEGISNIEGANGIFTASATDTLEVFLAHKKD